MSIQEGNIELHMGPSQLGAPDNLEEVIVGFIDGVKKRLDVAVQELESEPIARALIRARQRRVVVRVVIDGQVIIASSFNYTGPATRLNDENILIIGDLGAGDPAVRERQKRLGQFALNEIDRIIEVHGVRY